MLAKRLVIATVLMSGFSLFAGAAEAAAPNLNIRALRTRIFVMRAGDQEIVRTGQLSDTVSTDRIIVLFIGTGAGKLTVADADATGDTITLSGELRTTFPVVFNQSATSPDQIEQDLLVTRFGFMTADIGYASIVNGTPATYFYRLEF